MANQWLRLWHDMPTDPKWRTIARRSDQRIGDVIAVFNHVLVCASENAERGRAQSFNCEDVASALDLETEQVEAIWAAMQGRVLEGDCVIAWEKRQPSREDGAESSRGKGSADNYIYFVGTTDSYVVKIGVSRNPWARLNDMQTGSSGKLQILATVKTSTRSERQLHEYFKATRQKREWFARSAALNSLIQKLKEKSITGYDQCISHLDSLPVDAYVAEGGYIGTTKDKDTDQDTDKNPPPGGAGGESAEPTKAGAICKAIKAKGIANVSPSNPELLALIEKGVPVETFEAAAEICAKAKPEPKGFAYLLGIVKRQLGEAAVIASGAGMPVRPWDTDRPSIEAKGVELGLGKWNEHDLSLNREKFDAYEARVRRAVEAAQGEPA